MTITLARTIGTACAFMTALIIASASPSAAQSAPLSLSPAAQSKAKVAPVAMKIKRERRAHYRSPVWNTFTIGNADLAFLSALQYLEFSAEENAILVVAENEFSPLDFAAGTVRVVAPDELSEIDLASDPDVLLAQRQATSDTRPIQQASATPARTDDPDEDDGVLNRILMTFAGALAMASAMRMIIA